MNEGEVLDLEPFFKAISKKDFSLNINIFTTGRKLSQQTLDKFSLGDNFIEFGWVDYAAYPEILSCADVFLLLQKNISTNVARWPNKAGDYFAAGRPILTNVVGDIGEIAKQNPAVFYLADWTEESISARILEIHNQKPDISRFQKIREFANTHSWHNKATELENFYKSISNTHD